MRPLPSLNKLEEGELLGQVALVRVDFNVPLQEGQVLDSTRIELSLPSIRYVLDRNITVVLMSHLGRPKGSFDANLCLKPVMDEAAKLLDTDIILLEDPLSENARQHVREAKPGSVFYIENIRFFAEETECCELFSERLAQLADFFVMDAFGASHRVHASTVGLIQCLPSVAGFLFEQEIAELTRVLEHPKRPFMAIIGGSKISTKFALLRALLGKVDTLFIGGAMSFTLLKAQGFKVGSSMIEADLLDEAALFLEAAKKSNTSLLLPVDHVIADNFSAEANTKHIKGDIPEGWMGLDMGEKSTEMAMDAIKRAGFVFWNGPVGVFEMKAFEKASMAIAQTIADVDAYSLVGGGDSVSALKKAGCEAGIDFISSGGGASLAFIEGKRLPVLDALMQEKVGNGI